MTWTLSEATEFYDLAKAAYMAAVEGKSYNINTGGTSRALTRQELETLKNEMLYWKKVIDNINSGARPGLGMKFGIPVS